MPSTTRRQTVTTRIGAVPVGSSHPIVVQSMTNTDTADVAGTVRQVAALARAGRELVWLIIAVAFCVVEATVFVTDLPVTKMFSRRHLQKAGGRGR